MGTLLKTMATGPNGARGPRQLPAGAADGTQENADRTDARIVDMLREAELGAVELLVDAYAARVYRLALRMTGSPQDAEEIVQDVLWTVTRKIGTFNGDSAFRTWLYRIAVNAACLRLRRTRRADSEILLADVQGGAKALGRQRAPGMDSSPQFDAMSQRELHAALEAAVSALPEPFRAVFVLHDIEGASGPEVAAILDLTLASVKSRVHRSRLFLRQRLMSYVESQ